MTLGWKTTIRRKEVNYHKLPGFVLAARSNLKVKLAQRLFPYLDR